MPVSVLLCKKLVRKKRFPEVVNLILNFDQFKFQGFTMHGLYRFGLFEQEDTKFSKLIGEFLDGRRSLDIIVPAGNRKLSKVF